MQGAPQQVRIIGGTWKRTPLSVAGVPGLRPTPDRVRETLFNWLLHLRPDVAELSGLDLFAGTGALGFELASRGARLVTMVESHALALDGLRATRARLHAHQVEIIAGDALAVAGRLPDGAFDMVFLDPPFEASLRHAALVAARRLLAAHGLIYLEAPSTLTPAEAQESGFELVRAGHAGRVAFHLLRSPSA